MTAPSAAHDVIARHIVDAAYTVHTTLGSGLLESVYEQCLGHELRLRDLHVEHQLHLPVTYRGILIDGGFRIDLMVNRLIVVEIKAAERIMPIHEAQLLTYLKLSQKRIGLLINFNSVRIKDGIRRLING